MSLTVFALDGTDGGTEVAWGNGRFPYLVNVTWVTGGPLTLVVQSRDQRVVQVLEAEPPGWDTRVVHEDSDPAWVEIVEPVPHWLSDGRLVWTQDHDDTRRLVIGGEPVTPVGLHVRRVVHVGENQVLVQPRPIPRSVTSGRSHCRAASRSG